MDVRARLAAPPARVVLRSEGGWPLSRAVLLLTYIERASGCSRTVPLLYAPCPGGTGGPDDLGGPGGTDGGAGDCYCVFGGVSGSAGWWRDVVPAAPVRLLMAGQQLDATAEVLDSAVAAPEALRALRAYRRRFPWTVPSRDGVVMLCLRPRRTSAARPGAGRPVNRRVVVTRYGGPETLRVVEEALPQPGPGEVRVRVTAAEVNFTDLLLREGVYPDGPRPPFTPGYALVGVVDEVGPGAVGPGAGPGTDAMEKGRTVAAMTVHGACADYICLPVRRLVSVPPGVSDPDALAVVFTYATAYQLLHRAARVRAGERVLFQGAGGAVGTAALQLGRCHGLEMYGTAAGDTRAKVTALGATVIDYTTENVPERVRAYTGGGVDVVLDGIGGRTVRDSYRALRRGGRLVLFGHSAALSRGRARGLPHKVGFYLAMVPVFLRAPLDGKKVVTYRVAVLRDHRPDWYAQDVAALFGLLARGGIAPPVPEALPLTQAARAHERIGSGEAGKQILLCRPTADHAG
ncbi:zinc-binding dehydrogenase [Streptomyces sp. GC420]|uniref:zinc-binding dehydrogenase n=1 Tax=Streptomyces sp. GC420 TaxID=2697568 RepID=UPI0014152FA2|nr:zinc-binding dehydrogenase [Streptomyces sp. GC420]NBM20695.1 zinc-binding dehydrogenase [Streptomyces sp. GC420]